MSWNDALLLYRANENFQGAALLAQDSLLKRLAASWGQVPRKLPPLPPPGQEVDLEDLWKKTKIDFKGWGQLSGVSDVEVMTGFRILRGNGIILPDGSLHHLAEQLLKKEAAGRLMGEFGLKPGDLKK